jgi:hypothetical protein
VEAVSRPATAPCETETCDTTIEIQPVGAVRRFCDDCNRAKDRARSLAWRAVNMDAHRRHNRESARRRRRNGRLT